MAQSQSQSAPVSQPAPAASSEAPTPFEAAVARVVRQHDALRAKYAALAEDYARVKAELYVTKTATSRLRAIPPRRPVPAAAPAAAR